MKLGEKLTCSGLAGVSMCGQVPVQSLCLEDLGAELELMLAGHPFPRACWQLGGRGERGYTRAKCEQRLLCSLGVPILLDGVGPKVLEQNSDGGSKIIPSLISVHGPIQMCVCMVLCVLLCVCVFLCVFLCCLCSSLGT